MSVSAVTHVLPAQSGTALRLAANDALEIIDVRGRQVADVALFVDGDIRESFSAGRTLDYNERAYLGTGDALYSNRSSVLARIEHDDAGRHDYLLTPCSERMFELLRGVSGHPSCLSNLSAALADYGIGEDDVAATFNAFMNVEVAVDGRIAVRAPRSRAGDRVVLRAERPLIVGLTACSSEHSNDGTCKPVAYRLLGADARTSPGLG